MINRRFLAEADFMSLDRELCQGFQRSPPRPTRHGDSAPSALREVAQRGGAAAKNAS
jgi:hypothetical protein